MECKNCGADVPKHVQRCVVCQIDVGFPNVRAATNEAEKIALNERLENARVSVQARKCESVFNDFGRSILRSKVVIMRNISLVLDLVSSDCAMYTAFYKQVEAGSRLPEENKWDMIRPVVDEMLFPYYKKDISFGALSLDNRGSAKYGNYAIVLKEELISHRATVFEENPIIFCNEKHKLIAGSSIPYGYRALWSERDKLAMAKLHSELDSTTAAQQYPAILLSQEKTGQEDDFIEVHIFGPIHRRTIERVIGPKPKRKEDRVLFGSLKRKLEEVKAVLEII